MTGLLERSILFFLLNMRVIVDMVAAVAIIALAF